MAKWYILLRGPGAEGSYGDGVHPLDSQYMRAMTLDDAILTARYHNTRPGNIGRYFVANEEELSSYGLTTKPG
jgi:hypothetical protein